MNNSRYLRDNIENYMNHRGTSSTRQRKRFRSIEKSNGELSVNRDYGNRKD